MATLTEEVNKGCPACEHDGCFAVRFCVGCAHPVCVGCWGEHNNDEPPNDHTTAARPETRHRHYPDRSWLNSGLCKKRTG